MTTPQHENQVCPKCGSLIVKGEVAVIKSPILLLSGESLELFEHIPEMDKPKRDRRRHCGEWLLR